ncbi:MAG TPA: hypothetical protein VKR61_21555 [Bryobacteraceae bacterium]|nr:hypothetical protein [Bryobacteraceae bacterium]
MIYTSYEMIADCRAGRGEGWSYFLKQYLQVIRRLLAHYFPERAGDRELLERVLLDLCRPESGLFASLEPCPERGFVAELRQHALRAMEADRPSAPPEIAIDIETLGAALEPLTLTEKLAAWFEGMRYGEAETGRMLRMSAETAGKIRGRAAELIRAHVDAWRSTLLAENGQALERELGALRTKDCLAAKSFLDVIDGRATWRGREEIEQHVKDCWYCLDHYCRLLEVVDVLRTLKPLSEAEIQGYQGLLGIQPAKRTLWVR